MKTSPDKGVGFAKKLPRKWVAGIMVAVLVIVGISTCDTGCGPRKQSAYEAQLAEQEWRERNQTFFVIVKHYERGFDQDTVYKGYTPWKGRLNSTDRSGKYDPTVEFDITPRQGEPLDIKRDLSPYITRLDGINSDSLPTWNWNEILYIRSGKN